MLQETIVDKEEALQSMQAAITSIERSPYSAVGSRFRERAAERYTTASRLTALCALRACA
jgi:hypothetical protein